MAARIPFGYKIVDGKACVNSSEADRLKLFFRRFLEGETMAAAAKEAELDFSPPTYPHLLKRKEYTGTEYYPPLITAEYQKQLTDEWERRREEHPRKPKKHIRRGVRVYTDFWLERQSGEAMNAADRRVRRRSEGSESSEKLERLEDLLARAEAVYQRIRPKAESAGNQDVHTSEQ